jgi:geranylgeranyl reductase family protein
MRDVIVIGAGPAGLFAAQALVREGLDVLVLEEHPDVGVPTHCTGVVSAEIHDLFKVPDDIVLHRPSRCRVVAPGGVAATFDAPGEEVLVLDRAGLDRALAARAMQAGATLALGRRVESVAVARRHVDVAARGERLRARAVVLACGVTYRFTRALGWGLPAHVLHTAQVEVDAPPADALEVHLGRDVAPEGFGWLAPLSRGGVSRVKVGVLARGDAGASLDRLLDRAGVGERLRGPRPAPVRRLMPLAPVRRTYGDRVIAVGDAAGLTKPVTGGGIFYSLLSARLAAETLAEALGRDALEAGRLARYEARWRERLMPDIRTGRWFRYLLENLADRELGALVRASASDDVQAVIARTAQFNWHRGVILAMLRQPGIKSILLKALFR